MGAVEAERAVEAEGAVEARGGGGFSLGESRGKPARPRLVGFSGLLLLLYPSRALPARGSVGSRTVYIPKGYKLRGLIGRRLGVGSRIGAVLSGLPIGLSRIAELLVVEVLGGRGVREPLVAVESYSLK